MSYVYLVRLQDNHELVGAFHSHRAARRWAKRSIWSLDELDLTRMDARDDIDICGKHEACAEWLAS